MMAGIIQSANADQTVMGISVLKGNGFLLKNINALINEEHHAKKYAVIDGYHFGGYAKHPPELIKFMNDTYMQHHLPTDIVYTSKTFFGIKFSRKYFLEFISNCNLKSGFSNRELILFFISSIVPSFKKTICSPSINSTGISL